jgi:hypothetical protein
MQIGANTELMSASVCFAEETSRDVFYLDFNFVMITIYDWCVHVCSVLVFTV